MNSLTQIPDVHATITTLLESWDLSMLENYFNGNILYLRTFDNLFIIYFIHIVTPSSSNLQFTKTK